MNKDVYYEYDTRFKMLCNKIDSDRLPSPSLVGAYELAKKAHEDVTRDSGELYLNHPLSVAEILVEAGCDKADIIAAALLHDVVEDTKYTLHDIYKDFGEKIADLVDSATSVDNEPNADELEGLSKEEIDQLTERKILEYGLKSSDMRAAYYIKIADRIHNLRTIDCRPHNNRQKKANETKAFYLALVEKLSINCFLELLTDQIWRVDNLSELIDSQDTHREISLYEQIDNSYTMLCGQDAKRTSDIENKLKQLLSIDAVALHHALWEKNHSNCFVAVHSRKYTPHKIFQMINMHYADRICGNHAKVLKFINKSNIPLKNIIAVCDLLDDKNDLSTYLSSILKSYSHGENGLLELLSIIDIVKTEDNRFKIYFEDYYNSIYCVILVPKQQYIEYNYGHGKDVKLVKEAVQQNGISATDALKCEMIVYKRDKKNHIPLPKGATVLDFAFKLHEEMGLCAVDATVNGVKASLSRKLSNNDVVVINSDTSRDERNGKRIEFQPHAEINWLNIIVTDRARETIIDYLTKDIVFYRKNGMNKIRIAPNSTMLDFAFMLDEAIGLCTKGAIVNGEVVSLSTKIVDGDRIEIVHDAIQNESSLDWDIGTVHASLEWFLWVSNENSKEKLIEYFSTC